MTVSMTGGSRTKRKGKILRLCGMPLNLYRYDGHSEKVFAVRPLRVHGFIYGGSGNAGMGFSVKPPFWVRGFIHGGAVRPP